MAVYPSTFPDGTPYPTFPAGTNTVNVSTASQLSSALSNATAGQRIVLANGSYSGAFSMSGRNGTTTAGISIEAANTGSATFASGSTFRITNCSYVTVKGLSFGFDVAGDTFQFRGTSRNCRLTRCTFGPSSHSSSSAVSTMIFVGDDCHTIRIDHNEIRNKGTSGNGIRVYGSFAKVDAGQGSSAGCRWVRIDHNIFRSIKPEVGNDKEPIRYGVSTMSRTIANGVIERNYFTDCICEPEIISVKMGGIRTTGNTIYRCAGGPVIRHGTNSVMNDNYVVDRVATFGTTIGSGGFRFYDADHKVSYNYVDDVYGGNFQGPLLLDTGDAEGSSTNLNAHWRVVGATVERNIIVACTEGIRIGNNYSMVPRNCTIRDNLVIDAATGAAITQRVAPSNTVMTNNAYYTTTDKAGMTQDAATIWRKPGFGSRLTYLAQSDVGPSGDTADTDGTGAEISSGGGGPDPGPVAVPADVLNIGPEEGQNHFQLQYALDGSTGNNWTKVDFAQVAAGFAHDPYFKVVADQTLGVGGIPTATGPNVVLTTADSTSTLVITTSNRIYDGQGHTVKKIDIQADNVTVQNFYVRGAGNTGIYSQGANNTVQNCDIAQVTEGGVGDINGITFFGNGAKILYNKIDNLVSGALNGSHTDGIQCWATPSKNSSSDVIIKGNWINGPVRADEKHIHQGVMAEGPLSTDGGGGGSGVSQNWIVDSNYFNTFGVNQCLKFDDIHNVKITRNVFAGASNKLIELGSLSTGTVFYSDNVITGTYSSNGVSTTSGVGPATPTGTGGGTPSVQFRVRADSATTAGSSTPRCELRETRDDGTEMAFDALSGEHALHTRARITHLPAADPEVIVAQLHNGVTGDRVSIRTQLVSSQIKLLCRINGSQVDPRFDESYTVGDEFEILIKVLDGGLVEVYYQGSTIPIVTGQLESSGAGASWYWKLGAYAQFDESTVSSTEYVTVEHRDLWVTHGGQGVSAGPDVVAVAGQPVTIAASESGLTGVTSRRWTIVAAPDPGPGPGEQDLTQAAVRHGWGTPHALSDEFEYEGTPNATKWKLPGADWAGHSGNGRRRPERQTVTGGKFVMTGLANGDSGWCQHRLDVQYGRWEARVRSFAGAPSAGEPDATSNGNDYHPLLLLWPESNSRQTDGEYDFMENGAPGEATLEAYIHYPHPGTSVVQQEHFERPNSSLHQWHNIAMEWTSQHIKGFFDGVEWFSVSGGANSVRRNIQTMPAGHLVIQLDNFDGTDQTPATLELMWLRYYPL
jgi:Chondroitinase B/Alginate lyase/Glycosyl hydrolases family 16